MSHPEGSWSERTCLVTEPCEVRDAHSAIVLEDGRVLVVGGEGQFGVRLSSAVIYDLGTGWVPAGNTPLPHGPGHTATLLRNNRVLVLGGAGSGARPDIYNGTTWTQAPAPLGVTDENTLVAHTATLLDDPARCDSAGAPDWCGKVLVAGAQGRSTQLYDPAENEWSQGPLMNDERGGYPIVATATALGDGRVLLVGGNKEDGCRELHQGAAELSELVPTATTTTTPQRPPCDDGRTAEIFDPDTNLWTSTEELDFPTTSQTGGPLTPNHQATLLDDGRVLVAGGETWSPDLEITTSSRRVQMFDPRAPSNQWRPVAPMLDEHARGFSAELLNDGRVLVAGNGRGASGTRSVEIYDPVADTWTRAAPLTTGRREHSASRLADGSILVVGGITALEEGGEAPVATYELFGGASRPSVTALDPVSGPRTGGTRVTISGSGFADDARVLFGGQPALSTIVHDARRITAVAPAHPTGDTEVNVTVEVGTTTSPVPAGGPQRYRYLPAAGGWATAADPEQRRSGHTSTLLDDGTVLLAGGAVAEPAATELYDPATASWQRTGNLVSGARRQHTATRLPDGRVLVTGGFDEVTDDQPPLATAEMYDPSTRMWKAAAPLAVPRYAHTATLVGGKVVVAGGTTRVLGQTVALDSVEIFDAATGSWSAPARLRHPRSDHTATLVGTKVLLVGGVDGRYVTASAELYDPANSTSIELGALTHARAGHTATVLSDGSVLVAGGGSAKGLVAETELLRIGTSGEWLLAGRLSHGRAGHTASLLAGDAVLIAGGFDFRGGRSGLPLTEIYRASTGWRPGLRLLSPRSSHTASVVDGPRCRVSDAKNPCGTVLLVGGTEQRPIAEVFGESILQVPTIAAVEPRSGPTFGGTRVTITGFGLFGHEVGVRFGGAPVPPADIVLVGDDTVVVRAPAHPQGDVPVSLTINGSPATNAGDVRFAYGAGAWSAGGTCAARVSATATLLDDGKVLIAGGAEDFHIGEERSSLVELYDPATRRCTAVTPLGTARAYHSAVRLADGTVLVIGGQDRDGKAIASTERFDPATGRWSDGGSLVMARFSHTATVLADGRVLIAGGADDEEFRADPMDTAEVYDPVSRSWRSVRPMPVDRVNHTATLLGDGTVLVAGGLTPNDALAGGPASQGPRRTICAPPPEDVAPDLTVTLNQVHPSTCLTGADTLASAARYDPIRDRWSPVADMAVARYAHSATVLGGPACRSAQSPPWCGLVLIAGGGNGGGSIRSAELFDPAAGTWRATGQLRDTRGGHEVAAIPGGRVLVAGSGAPFPGDTQDGPLATAEIYDPVTERWSLTDTMLRPRAAHAMVALPTGDVVVAGGYSAPSPRITTGTPAPLATDPAVEVYTPAPLVTGVAPRALPAAGAGGEDSGGRSVTVTGHGLARATAASLDGAALAPGALTPRSDTQAGLQVPARDPGHAFVAVEGPGGTSASVPANPGARVTYLGTPAAVGGLTAAPAGAGEVVVAFRPALASAGREDLGVVSDYEVRQTAAGGPGASSAGEEQVLCGGLCASLGPQGDGVVRVRVTDLAAGTYRYAVRPVNAAGVIGPAATASAEVAVGAGGTPARCPAPVVPGAGQLAYPGGRYSLVGLPAGTVVASDSPLYSWFDLGAGGTYAAVPGATPVAAGRGYWAWFACQRIVALPGAGSDVVRAGLGGYRASMVGNPSAGAPATVTGHDFAARWDPQANAGAGGYRLSAYRGPEVLAVGEGTWVFAYDDTAVVVRAR